MHYIWNLENMEITFVLGDLRPDCLKCFTVSASISEIFWKQTKYNIITLRNEMYVCIYLQNVEGAVVVVIAW